MKILKRSTKKNKAKEAVAMAKERVYDDLYAGLETKEGEKKLYRLARQRDRAGKDVQHMRVIKDENGNVMVNSKTVLKRWKEYFEKFQVVGSVVEWLKTELMISMVSVQNPFAPFCCVLGKDTLRHFPLLGSLDKQF